jgi:hypothetical protein
MGRTAANGWDVAKRRQRAIVADACHRSIVPALIALRHNSKPIIARTFGARRRRGASLRARDIPFGDMDNFNSTARPGPRRARYQDRDGRGDTDLSPMSDRHRRDGAPVAPLSRFGHARRKRPCRRGACAHAAERAVMILRETSQVALKS